MIITLKEAKLYLRIDDDFTEEDRLIKELINVSEEYLKNATGIEFNCKNELAKLFCKSFIADAYENREQSHYSNRKISHISKSIMLQLKNCYDAKGKML